MNSLRRHRSLRLFRFAPALALVAAALCTSTANADDPPAATPATPPATPAPPAPNGDKPPADKPGGAGGDGGAKPKAAAMIIEEVSNAPEPPPPAPVGEEKKLIGEYVISRQGDVQDCYQARIRERATLQGRLVVHFHIGPNGRVIGASAEGIGDSQLVACVVTAVRKWEFEKPLSGGKLRVDFPFKLTPQATQ